MTQLLAYRDKESVAPGEAIKFMVSCHGAERYRADIVRLSSPEAGPDAPPYREEVVDLPVNGDYPGRVQEIDIGSWAYVPASPVIDALQGFTIQAFIWPTLPGSGSQALLGAWSENEGRGFGLFLNEAGALEGRIGDGNGEIISVSTEHPLLAHHWYLVAMSFDTASNRLQLLQTPVESSSLHADYDRLAETEANLLPAAQGLPFLLAAWHDGPSARKSAAGGIRVGGHFNGKIDAPRLCNRGLNHVEVAMLAEAEIPAELSDSVIAAWDFSHDISSEKVSDISGNGRDGETQNMPARAMTGHNWTGAAMRWQDAPEQYGAIHFHEDDLYDAGWQADFALTVPEEMKSGVYAARLAADEAEFLVPFFVRPPKGRASADIVYLASTATYTVYTNNIGRMRNDWTEVVQGRLTILDDTDLLMLDHPELGLSTYDTHRDGSGVCLASRLRPATNVRPKGRLWNFCADMFIVDWLERSGQAYDVVTDEDLHREGPELLAPYRVLVTGSHPEYYSAEMLDGLEAWLRQGGRMMYMGGNGFYWRIAYHPEKPGLIEVRRAEDGTRAWIAETGEYYHAFTGEYGGMWRRQGRAPNLIAGVGFIAQGFDASSYFRRTEASNDARAGFIFEGIEEEILGDFGIMQGGAAGLELDCHSIRLGTPPHALVVASSEGHSNVVQMVNEEIAVAYGATDGVQNDRVRADMVFFEVPGGGAVFSTGSIAYAGALGHNNFDNNIAHLTTNVLTRFLDPEPFMPPA